MSIDHFDYDPFFGENQSPTTSSNQTSSSPRSDLDLDIGIANTPQINSNFDDTVLDLNNFDLTSLTENELVTTDGNIEFENFSSFLNENKIQSPEQYSTFDNLFSNFGSPEQSVEGSLFQAQHVLPVSPSTSTIPKIINCVKVGSIPNFLTKVSSPLKFEPTINKNSTITIVRTSNSIVKPNESMINLNSPETRINKRLRSVSPDDNTKTLTLEQLRAQYGNLNDEALKKHLRMIKNRESASLSRKRRKELMEHLDTKVKSLTTENEQLKKENSKLVDQIRGLKIENELLKKYRLVPTDSTHSTVPKKPIILLSLTILLVFKFFVFSSIYSSPSGTSGEIELFHGDKSLVPSRTILSEKQRDDQEFYSTSSLDENRPLSYPYIQCVAFINKTHSTRINQDLRSLVEEPRNNPKLVLNSDSLTIHPKTIQENLIEKKENQIVASQSSSKRIALRNQRSSRQNSAVKNQVEPYKKFETYHNDFIQSINRKNDTVYFVSFKRDHLIFPATAQNQTQRPKMSIILPASMANLNKSIDIPSNHIPMIKIDCEVEDTQLVFINQNHIPFSYRHDLLQYYSSSSQTNI